MESRSGCSAGDEAHTLLTGLQSQTDHLLRRVQRLQTRQCDRHLQHHLQSYVRHQQTASGIGCQLRKVRDNSAHSNGRIQHKSADSTRFLDRDGVKPTSALVDFVRSWEQHHSLTATTDSYPHTDPSADLFKPISQPAVPPHDRQQQQVQSAAGQLRANIQHLEQEYDSDATDSSSGGESGDDGFGSLDFSHHSASSKKQNPVNPRDSMLWSWSSERAAIASRWMWLIAQVADLEFKIRQQNEMYRSLRLSKGPITLENTASGADSSQCVRTMALRDLKKRKLVRCPAALTGAVRKVARYSSVQCSCASLPNFVAPCVLCNGRYGYVQVIDTDCMPPLERIAILDPSCHPVLTLPTQVPLGLHFSKFLKKETLQKSIARKPSRPGVSGGSNHRKAGTTLSPESTSKFLKDIRRNNHKKSHALISSNKLKKKYESNSKRKYPHSNCEFSSSGKRSKTGRERHESSSIGSNDSSRQDSPIQSPLPAENAAPKRRRSEYAYDINNIVIPYSIASTTRVEKLQYKEILTPKWREISDFAPQKQEAVHSEDDDVEDLSDSAFNERHMRCELEEKKRFLTFLTPNPASGGSGPKRARSTRVRCDSKGDVLTAGNNGYGNHADDCNSQDSEISNHANNNSIVTSHSTDSKDAGPPAKDPEPVVHGVPARTFERRRTTSSSRTRDDSVDDEHLPDVIPFEKRIFPLTASDVDDLLSDAEEVNGEHHHANGGDGLSPEKTVFTNGTENSVSEPATPVKGPGMQYASSGGETDHEEEEDPEWEPKEQT